MLVGSRRLYTTTHTVMCAGFSNFFSRLLLLLLLFTRWFVTQSSWLRLGLLILTSHIRAKNIWWMESVCAFELERCTGTRKQSCAQFNSSQLAITRCCANYRFIIGHILRGALFLSPFLRRIYIIHRSSRVPGQRRIRRWHVVPLRTSEGDAFQSLLRSVVCMSGLNLINENRAFIVQFIVNILRMMLCWM